MNFYIITALYILIEFFLISIFYKLVRIISEDLKNGYQEYRKALATIVFAAFLQGLYTLGVYVFVTPIDLISGHSVQSDFRMGITVISTFAIFLLYIAYVGKSLKSLELWGKYNPVSLIIGLFKKK